MAGAEQIPWDGFRHPKGSPETLRVRGTEPWGTYGFYTRNRNNAFGNTLCNWVLGLSG